MTVTAYDQDYWAGVTATWGALGRDRLWRAHSDAVNRGLLAGWRPDVGGRLLKTDGFDESVSEGVAPALTARGFRVITIDVSASVLRAARRRQGRGAFVVADTRALPFRDRSFDGVFSNSTLDHFQTPGDLAVSLAELGRILRGGGRLLLTMDNLANPMVALRNLLPFRFLHRIGLVPYYVGVTCGPRGLRRLLAASGFRVTSVGGCVHCPRALAVLVGRWVERFASHRLQQGYLHALMAWERLERWPTRYLTGHFVLAWATRHDPGAVPPRTN